MALVEVVELTKSFGKKTAVQNLSFEVNNGEIVGFVGPNGAGKTTTMRIMATLLEPTKGDVKVNGHSVLDDPRAVRQFIGFMPDAFGIYDNITVREYLLFFAAAHRVAKKERAKVVDDVMELTELTGVAQNYASVLSKGMRQRLCVAKTLIHDPSLLILDEPAAGLDPRARIELRALIAELRELDKGIFISSHILTELAEICDRVVIIELGELVATGAPSALAEAEDKIGTRVAVRAMGELNALVEAASALKGVLKVARREGRAEVLLEGGENESAELLAALVSAGVKVTEFRPLRVDLEEAFMRMTKGDVA